MLTRSGNDVRPVRSVMAELDALVRAECEALRSKPADDLFSAHERRRIERTARWLRSRPNAEWLFEEIRTRTWPGEPHEAPPPAQAPVAESEKPNEPPPTSQENAVKPAGSSPC